ncbi:MAG: rhodanese-like domain-containing protein [Bacteroidia bacterium]
MFIHQLYTNCLAQAAYYIESEGEALIVDPLREPYPYLELAKHRGAKIKYVFETHFHADFVSGHVELARQTDAVIIYGPNAKPKYPAVIAEDHEKFQLGKITLEVLHTPGHTIESSCLLLYDENNKVNSIFTGDCLFVGDVGRPDLLSGNLNKEELASMLYDSLNTKIKTLADDVIVYPGHGAGSACGKNIGKEATTTIGQQKKYNYAMQNMSRADFIKVVTENLPTPPAYFFKDAKINVEGYDNYETTIEHSSNALSTSQFKQQIKEGAIILDDRSANEFAAGFIPNSINIGLDGGFAVFVGSLIPFNTPLILVSPVGQEQESLIRLARIGYDNIKGYLKGGIESWKKEKLVQDAITCIEAGDLENYIKTGEYTLVDVRNKSEGIATGKLKNALTISLDEIQNELPKFSKDEFYILYCAGGYRSMIAASILKRAGITNVFSVIGGIKKIKEEVAALVEFV